MVAGMMTVRGRVRYQVLACHSKLCFQYLNRCKLAGFGAMARAARGWC